LFDIETNIRYGMAHLSTAWKLAAGDLCQTLLKYRTSYGESEITPRISAECTRLKATLEGSGSSLTAIPEGPAGVQPQRAPFAAAELPKPPNVRSVTPEMIPAEPPRGARKVSDRTMPDHGAPKQAKVRAVPPKVAAARERLAAQRSKVREYRAREAQQRSAKIHASEERLRRLLATICTGCAAKTPAATKPVRAPLERASRG
jgi:hypothetical protein